MDPSGRQSTGYLRRQAGLGDLTSPDFWIVAGPNGSGKSTLIRHGALDVWTSGLRALSPDDVVIELRVEHPDRAEIDLLRAAQEKSDAQVLDAIRSGRSVMVETVLSSDKFKAVVTEALGAGFLFGFVFVTVSSADMNEARVRNRVARGGHDVPPDRIRARRTRAHAAAGWFAARAMIGLVVENSGLAPVLLAEKVRDEENWRVLEASRLEALGLVLEPPPI